MSKYKLGFMQCRTKKQWKLVDKLLLEKLPFGGISIVKGISDAWPQRLINKKLEQITKIIDAQKKDC